MSIHTTNLGAASEIEKFAMTNCLMILSSQAAAAGTTAGAANPAAENPASDMFECKTCGRKFPSFQALGGHRASHKKVKLLIGGDRVAGIPPEKKPKIHACSICGQEFPTGQALGGHMRRHRPVAGAGGSTVTTEGSTENSDGNNCGDDDQKKRKNDVVVELLPVAREKSSCGKRVCLDLNLNYSSGTKEDEEDEDEDEDESEVEEGEIVEEKRDFLKLELRQPINNYY